MSADTPSRLLAMLNAATSPPASSSPVIHAPPAPSSNIDAGTLKASSPREPTPAPPQPGLQTLSIHELFKNLSPPPQPASASTKSTFAGGGSRHDATPVAGANGEPVVVGSTASERAGERQSSSSFGSAGTQVGAATTAAPSAASASAKPQGTSTAVKGKEDQQARLLGMLSMLGAGPAGVAKPSTPPIGVPFPSPPLAWSAEGSASPAVTAPVPAVKRAAEEKTGSFPPGPSVSESPQSSRAEVVKGETKQQKLLNIFQSSANKPAQTPVPVPVFSKQASADPAAEPAPGPARTDPATTAPHQPHSDARAPSTHTASRQPTPTHSTTSHDPPGRPASSHHSASPQPPLPPAPAPASAPAAESKPSASTSFPPPIISAPPQAPTPQKSPFHFDSPFDAFGPPRSRAVSQLVKPEVKQPVRSKTDVQPRQLSDANGDSQPAAAAPAEPASPARSAPAGSRVRNEAPGEVKPTRSQLDQVVNAESSPVAHLQSPLETASLGESMWDVRDVTAGARGNGPARMGSHTVIDLSKPNLDSLISDDLAAIISPATIMANEVKFCPGRVVGVTEGWLAYALPQCRIRLIDRNSGARVLLHLPHTSVNAYIIDMAVTPDMLVAVSSDHAVSAFRVPRSWNLNDPQCEVVLNVRPPPTIRSAKKAEQLPSSVEDIFQVEWVKKGDKTLLALGGTNGVMVVDLIALGICELDAHDLGKHGKLLLSEGEAMMFCINHAHSVIAILSSTSYLTLYATASLNRVWHRQIPSSVPTSQPTSIQFCESNLLVGRDNNTFYDLIQVTTELAVLSSIRFVAPAPCRPSSHFTHAVYDSANEILWVSSPVRASLYGFRYAIKGRPPFRAGETNAVVAFDHMAEIPLETVLSLVQIPGKSQGEAGFLYAYHNGINLVSIDRDVVERLAALPEEEEKAPDGTEASAVPEPVQEAGGEEKGGEAAQKATRQIQSSGTKVVTPKSTPPQPSKLPQPSEKAIRSSPSVSAPKAGPSDESKTVINHSRNTTTEDDEPVLVERPSPQGQDVSKLLKRTEDRIVTQLRQAVSANMEKVNARIDAIGGETLAQDVAARVKKQVSPVLKELVKEEFKKESPLINSAIQDSIRSIAQNAIPGAVTASLQQILPLQMERNFLPVVHQSVSKIVQQSLDRALQESLQRIVVPAVAQSTTKLFDTLAVELKSELLQIRKEMEPPAQQPPPIDHEPTLRLMAESIQELRQQVASLTAQLKSAAPAAPPAQARMAHAPSSSVSSAAPAPVPVPPPVSGVANPVSGAPPGPPSLPSRQFLEDTFLAALSQQGLGPVLSLIPEFWPLTEQIFPVPSQGLSPLSPAVLLTLFHRLAQALAEVPPADPIYVRVLVWEKRLAPMFDPRLGMPGLETMGDYLPRVVEFVRTTLEGTVRRLPVNEPAGRGVREVLQSLAGQRGQ